jgi:hypothetical protein
LLVAAAASLLQGFFECCELRVQARSAAGRQIAGAAVTAFNTTVITSAEGTATIRIAPGTHEFAVRAEGFLPIRQEVAVSATVSEIEFVLQPVERSSITVAEQAADPAPAIAVTGDTVKLLPADPPAVRDALPLIPGIVRGPSGNLSLSGSGEHRSTFQINGLDVTDPGTGSFGRTVPIDSVATLNVYRSPFLTEFGRFGTDVVAVETKRGGDKWRYELNDPTPEFRIRSRHVVGVRGFTPRFSFNGPLVRNHLYFSQSTEYALRKVPSFTLLFPRNEEKQEGWNSLTQFDYLPNRRQWLTITLHGAPQHINHVRPGFYDPLEATPSWRGHEYRGAAVHKWNLASGVLESSLSGSEVASRTGAQGENTFVLTPTANLGNYFARQSRTAQRWQIRQAYATAPIPAAGAHHVKFGFAAARTTGNGEYESRPFQIADFRRIDFRNQGPYTVHDFDIGAYGQDHWVATPALSIDWGVRTDWQRLSGRTRLAPRFAASWAPWVERATTFRAGYGWFYDRVPLNVFAFPYWPERPPLTNVLHRNGEFAPYSRTFNATAEHRFPKWVRLRIGYLDSASRGLIVLQPGPQALLLTDEGSSRYRQLETLARFNFRPEQEIMFSYIRGAGRGNLNDFTRFLGDFPAPVIRPNFVAEPDTNIPHRILMWGVIPLTARWRISPTVEYRTGFPYSAYDASQDYAGEPNARRFPAFFSFDFRVARDIAYRGHLFRVSLSFYNLTNHWNPDTVRHNTADPLFGQFLGQRSRRFRLDFDFLK